MRTRLIDRLLSWRDSLLASPRIQNLVVSLPLLRPVANRRARQIFDLCIGFVHTQVVTACIEFDVFERLARGPLTPAELAEATGLTPDAAERLLRATASLNLIRETRDGRFRLAELGAAVRGAEGVAEIVRHNQVFYRDLTDPVALLKGERETELAEYWPYAEGAQNVDQLAPTATAPYTRFMAATQPFIAEDIFAAYDFSRHKAVLDVGGGSGRFISALAERHPALRVGVLDLPSVADQARAHFEGLDLDQRANVHSGDFHRELLPRGYDAITLVRILLDHDDATVLRLLLKVRDALESGGSIVVAELMSGTPGAETITDAYFAFYLMAMGKGRPRSVDRIRELLAEAGFRNVRAVATRRTLMTQLVVGDVV